MAMTWQWEVFLQDPGGNHATYLEWLMSAWGWTALVSVLALFLSLILGSIIGVMRTLPNHRFAVLFGHSWAELFRNIPLLVQLFLWYHVIPAFIPALKDVPGFVLVVVTLGLFTSSRIADQFVAGIKTLSTGQRYAGMALGMTTFQCYRFVLLPVVIRIIIPPLTNEAMNIVKNSSVAFAVSVMELTLFARQVQEETARGIEVYLAVTGLYIVSAFTVNLVMTWIEKRMHVPGVITVNQSSGGR